MSSLSPVTLAALVVFALALVGVAIASLKSRATFKHYAEIAADARRIARALNRGEVFRDGADLVVTGNFGRLPVIARFSHSENTPGLNLRMGAPSTFAMSATPSNSAAGEGRATIRTGTGFDSRFLIRSDQPHHVRMLLGSADARQNLEQICCSNKSFLALARGYMELSELLIPAPYTARHVLDHVEAMGNLAAALATIPGAETVKVESMRREHSSPILRIAVVVGIVAAIVGVASEAGRRQVAVPPEVQAAAGLPVGVPESEARLISGLAKWRLAAAEDFDPNAVSWMRASGHAVAGRVTAELSGRNTTDVAYVLTRFDGTRRVVLLVDGENRYDANFPYIGIVARVPKSSIAIPWQGRAPEKVDGDGLLITRKADDPTSGLVFFLSGNRITTAVPANYQNLRLD